MKIRHDPIRQQVLDRDKIIAVLNEELETLAIAFSNSEKELHEERVRTENTGDCRVCTRIDRKLFVDAIFEKEHDKEKLRTKIRELEIPWYKKIFKSK
jgi:pyruvate kinase